MDALSCLNNKKRRRTWFPPGFNHVWLLLNSASLFLSFDILPVLQPARIPFRSPPRCCWRSRRGLISPARWTSWDDSDAGV
jgi:hypothetical protein